MVINHSAAGINREAEITKAEISKAEIFKADNGVAIAAGIPRAAVLLVSRLDVEVKAEGTKV